MSQQIPVQVDLSKYIETRLFQERPHIRNKRIPVATIIRRARLNNWTSAETADDLGLSEAEVLAAMLYYEEHHQEINQQEKDEDTQFYEMKRLCSRTHHKLLFLPMRYNVR